MCAPSSALPVGHFVSRDSAGIFVSLYLREGAAGDFYKIHIVFPPTTAASHGCSALLRFANPHISNLYEFVTEVQASSVSRCLVM